jgi:regulator of RNase E activity RraA
VSTLDPVVASQLRTVSIATLTTVLMRRGLDNVWLRGVVPVGPAQPRLVGPAFTLRFIPSRADIDQSAAYREGTSVHQRAFESCPPGHVLVVDTHGEMQACTCGDLLIARLRARGGAGIVTDGGFRDTEAVASLGFPAYHVGPVPAPSFLRLQAVALDEPIGCAGVAIWPGDVMVGDREGVVAIPAAMVRDVAADAIAAAGYDAFALAKLAEGRAIPGLYPPNAAARTEYEAWTQRNAAPPTDR